jgi:hypothetical protein
MASSHNKIEVKNSTELEAIPKTKLFISESGFAYNVSEVANFLRGEQRSFWGAIILFQDFKNQCAAKEASIDNKSQSHTIQSSRISVTDKLSLFEISCDFRA